jgi:hypothetical protein
LASGTREASGRKELRERWFHAAADNTSEAGKPFIYGAGMMRRSIASTRGRRANGKGVLPAVAIGETAPTYRDGFGAFLRLGPHPQAPEKNRFFGDFSV